MVSSTPFYKNIANDSPTIMSDWRQHISFGNDMPFLAGAILSTVERE